MVVPCSFLVQAVTKLHESGCLCTLFHFRNQSTTREAPDFRMSQRGGQDIQVNYTEKCFLMTVRDRVAQIQPHAVVCLLVVRQTDVR